MQKLPNLRAVKPAIQYRNERSRIVGRERVAHELNRTLTNATVHDLNVPVLCADLVEVYKNRLRMLDGYSFDGSKIIFKERQTGDFTFIVDTLAVDEGERWLKLNFKEFIDHKTAVETAYTTDRRQGLPDVKTRTTPVVMIQPTIGFCRPSTYGESLLFCPFMGMYGRDTITYALRTDAGQLSEFRCINIRVLDPNYVPPIQCLVLTPTDSFYKINGDLNYAEVEEGEDFARFNASGLGVLLEPPNTRSLIEQQYVRLVLRGRDEIGDYYDLAEYYEPKDWNIEVVGTDNYSISLAFTETGIVGNMVSILLDRSITNNIQVKLTIKDDVRFSATIRANAIEETQYMRSGKPNIAFDPDVEIISSEVTADGAAISFNYVPTTLTLSGTVNLTTPYVGPAGGTFNKVVPVNYTRQINSPGEVMDSIVISDTETLLWATPDPFSQMYKLVPAMYSIGLNAIEAESD